MNKHIISLILFFLSPSVFGQMKTVDFNFEFNSIYYSGFIDYPEEIIPQSIVIIIPGSGKTNFLGEGGWSNWYHTLRSHFVQLGFAVCAWDRAGCGKSEGKFDGQQPVQNSSKEALAAIKKLRSQNILGAEKIGLWGISRGGWICPLIIEEDPSIAFWISVSGVDSLENSNYLLETNLKINGKSEEEVNLLMDERLEGSKIFRNGGSFEDYIKATQNLRKNSFNIKMYGTYTKDTYLRDLKGFISNKDKFKFDEKTGSLIFLTGFEKILNKIACPVLAIFGEKDSQVDWRSAKSLYENTIGKNQIADLSIKTLPFCNHNIQKCSTGGFFENLEKYDWQTCEGYFETMTNWLEEKVLGDK